MNKDVHQLFKEENTRELPRVFVASVIARINAEAQGAEKRQRVLWGTFSALSFAAVFFAGAHAANLIGQSGFESYFSLLFSDGGTVAGAWKEFGLSLLESLPIIGTALFLGSMYLLLLSMKKFLGARRPSLIGGKMA